MKMIVTNPTKMAQAIAGAYGSAMRRLHTSIIPFICPTCRGQMTMTSCKTCESVGKIYVLHGMVIA